MMNESSARHILGVTGNTDEREIKSRYRQLILRFHPDSVHSKEQDPDRAREVIEAYRFLTGQLKTEQGSSQSWWDAPVNLLAYCERPVFFRYQIYDYEDLPATEVARGRYLWEPEMEEFMLFTRSVLDVCRALLTGADKEIQTIENARLFHLLMQEYVDPWYCLPRLDPPSTTDCEGRVWYDFKGYVAVPAGTRVNVGYGDELHVLCHGNTPDVFVMDDAGDKPLGRLSFDGDHLYYVLLPLLDRQDTQVRITVDRLDQTIRRKGKNRIRLDIQLTCPRERWEIPVCNREQIDRIINDTTTE